MSQAQHTPGPWAMTADGSGFYVEGGNLLVAVAQEVDKHSPDIDGYMAGKETEANARLIAAAPELLEALILLEAEMVASGNANATDFGWPLAIQKTRAAISKATGDAQ